MPSSVDICSVVVHWLIFALGAFLVYLLIRLQNVAEPPTSVESSTLFDISRNLATIHQMCCAHLDELKKLSSAKVS